MAKFLPIYGSLYCSSTWKQLFLMPLDRKVIDLNWNVCHGVLYTAAHLSSFGYNHSTTCFCGFRTETSEHLFFCLSPCSQCSGLDPISSSGLLLLPVLWLSDISYFVFRLMRCVLFHVCLFIFFFCASTLFGFSAMTADFNLSVLVQSILSLGFEPG